MKKITIKDLIINASIAAIYVVLTLLLGNLSYGPVQFRVAEILVLLCFFDKKYIIPLTLGCFISNLMSPYGIYDIAFGTLATVLSLITISKSKNLFVASLFPVIFNGVIVAFEISLLSGVFTPEVFLFDMFTIMIGEFVCVSIIGVILFTVLKKNDAFMSLITNKEKIKEN